MVDSCGDSVCCNSIAEQYCNNMIFTYNGINHAGTLGGFTSAMVFHQKFVVRIPDKLSVEQAAPLLCAGVTAYSPSKQFIGSKKSQINAEILGLGGVDHMGVLLDMGHHVTVISSSDKKKGIF
ncbi:hypothetical protein MKX01_019576 [Papaver californicum]|nr:hypothetical protein MKX01_019576 [Papaver californicum]